MLLTILNCFDAYFYSQGINTVKTWLKRKKNNKSLQPVFSKLVIHADVSEAAFHFLFYISLMNSTCKYLQKCNTARLLFKIVLTLLLRQKDQYVNLYKLNWNTFHILIYKINSSKVGRTSPFDNKLYLPVTHFHI